MEREVTTTVSTDVQFLLNGEPHVARGVQHATTLLAYLRQNLGLTGSKEGCGEGDCGACTAVVAELDDTGQLLVKPVNACIQLLIGVAGKALFTVEGLAAADELHPVQQALARCHASQCGFCTPGVVMALFSLMKNTATPTRSEIEDALSGNLCRCTGYRPIMEAARILFDEVLPELSPDGWIGAPHSADSSVGKDLIAALLALQQRGEKSESGSSYFRPRNMAELLSLMNRHPQAILLAGGSDIDNWQMAPNSPQVIVDLMGIGALSRIQISPEMFEIGATASISAAIATLEIDAPHVAGVRRRFGGPAIRENATIGGNIANASPIGDTLPTLLVLDAQLRLRSPTESVLLSVEEFVRDRAGGFRSDQLIECVQVPRPGGRSQFRAYKIARRFDQDIATVCAAFLLVLDDQGIVRDIRIAFGGVDSFARRARRTESAIRNRIWDEHTLERAFPVLAGEFDPISDVRGSADYRRTVSCSLLERFYLETMGNADVTVWDYSETSA